MTEAHRASQAKKQKKKGRCRFRPGGKQFNVSVREEAEKTFPPHADCKGVHQLAFRHVGRRFQSKLVQDLKEADVQSFLKAALGGKVKTTAALVEQYPVLVMVCTYSWEIPVAPGSSFQFF